MIYKIKGVYFVLEKIPCIYIIKNKVNGKIYIGKTKDFYDRKRDHFNALRKNEHCNDHMQMAFNKYGEENFEMSILEVCAIEELDEKEIYYINKYNSRNRKIGYNIKPGGEGGEIPPETRAKISASHKEGWLSGRIKPYHREMTEEQKEFHVGILMQYVKSGSENQNAKKVVCLNDKKIFDTIQEASDFYNIPRTYISTNCTKNHLTAYGKIFMYYEEYENMSEEDVDLYVAYVYKRKQVAYLKNAKKVICINTGEIFYSIASAARSAGVDISTLAKHCKGRSKYCGKDKTTGEKLKWKYLDN